MALPRFLGQPLLLPEIGVYLRLVAQVIGDDRVTKRCSSALPDDEPRFLTKRVVLAAHEVLIDQFGGSHGLRDEGLLDSALAQPEASFGGQFLHPTVHDEASAYLYHLVKNHPWLDGNKRTAYAAMRVFLEINGYDLDLSQDAKYRLVMDVAEERADKEQVAAALRKLVQRTPADSG